MSGKTFLDTNILVYAVDQDVAPRRDASRKVIESVVSDGSGAISTQVMTFTVFEIVQVSPELIQDAIDCVLIKYAQVAVGKDVILERLEFQTELHGEIVNRDGPEIRQAGAGTD